ncbi:MAG: BLUF domain-containing protein [Flavobacterium sp.]|nr:BLUF domain-containing protein [Flavobacterium sp.]
MSLFQLTYQSKAVSHLNLQDLENILNTAKNINSEHNITGCLVFYNGNFVQILEGNEVSVKKIYSNIVSDKRHHSINLLWECETNERFFNDWNMGYYTPTEDESLFVSNYKLLSSLSDKSQGILLSFWSAVDRALIV